MRSGIKYYFSHRSDCLLPSAENGRTDDFLLVINKRIVAMLVLLNQEIQEEKEENKR